MTVVMASRGGPGLAFEKNLEPVSEQKSNFFREAGIDIRIESSDAKNRRKFRFSESELLQQLWSASSDFLIKITNVFFHESCTALFRIEWAFK